MQLKTANNVLRKKMDEWLYTISDKDLAKDVKKNLLVSGGSILSLLTNKEVNDYDVYLKDRDVLMRLVKYYITPFKDDLSILDGNKKSEYEGEYEKMGFPLKDAKGLNPISIRNLKPGQIKIFIEEKSGGLKVNEDEDKEAAKSQYLPVFFSPNAISLANNVQIVIRFWGDNEAIHKTFDFIHATNYFTFEDGIATNKAALESILSMTLKYQGSQYPLTSIIRMKKFIKRGWNIGAGEILKIMFQVSELNLKDPDTLEEQLIGVDVAYFALLIEALRTVDPAKITSAYINEIIDRVFGDSETQQIDEQ